MQISSPRELLASIPHILGFQPSNSVVVVAFDADEVVAAVRADIDVVRIAMVQPLIHALAGTEDGFLAVVYYTDDHHATVDWQDELAQALSHPVLDSLLVTTSHWRSLLCHDVECCPIEGHPLNDGTAMMDAFLVFNGSAPFRTREELVNSLLPAQHSETTQKAIDKAFGGNPRSDPEAEHHWIVDLVNGASSWDVEQLGRVCLALSDFHVRDAVLRSAYDDPKFRSILKIALHTNLHLVPESLVAPAVTVLAGCAWLDGNGVLANVAIARALDVDANYSLAQLLDRALTHGVPPHVWAESLAAVSMERCLAGAA